MGIDIADLADEAARLLEAGGLRHKSHARHIGPARADVEKVLRHYWARQEAAVLAEIKPRLAAILAQHPPPAMPVHEADSGGGEWAPRSHGHPVLLGGGAAAKSDRVERAKESKARSPLSKQVAQTILPSSVSPLRFPVTKGEYDDYADALDGAIAAAATVLAAEVKSGAVIPDDFAGRYLRENSLSKLTGNFSGESVKQIQNAIADAWQAGGSYDQVVQAVQDTFEQFSSVRAGMIAQTEVNQAYVAGRDAMAHQLGYEEKRWSADGTECCDECQEQIDAGWIGLDDDFPIGDDPPGHVNCDCSVDYRQGYGGD